jgi:hypothetical protein
MHQGPKSKYSRTPLCDNDSSVCIVNPIMKTSYKEEENVIGK